jgi:multiple sugar transport system permease protein
MLLLGSVVTLLPFVWLIRSSLMGPAQIFSFPIEWIPNPVRWENYPDALTAVPFDRYLFNTMRIEVLVIAGTLVTSTVSAFAFARLRWRGRNLVFGILLSGLMLPYAATLIPTFILWQKLGGLGTIAPLVVPAWFGGGIFNIFLLRQFFMTIPRDLDEAAYIDGATPLGVLIRIILPLSKPALIVVSIFTFISVWNDFLGPLIYLGNESQYTLAIGLRAFSSAYTAQWDQLMAASTAVVIPIVVLFFLAQRYFVEGIALTGIKG